jgi:putative (di)nucleoside polyphosphate hydrolase
MARKKSPAPTYRRGVGIALINDRGQVWVGERFGLRTAWQMPQGGIDKGEAPRAAALRELEEEIGTNKARIIGVTRGWVRYDLPEKYRPKHWGGKFIGQEQKWYLMKFTGDDADINCDTEHPEFARWKWLAFRQLPRVAVDFKRSVYKEVVKAFAEKVAAIGAKKKR